MPSSSPNYLLKVILIEVSTPLLTRTLSLPPATSWYALHLAIQTSFGWSNTHDWSFLFQDQPLTKAGKPRAGAMPDKLLEIKQLRWHQQSASRWDDWELRDAKLVDLETVLESGNYVGEFDEEDVRFEVRREINYDYDRGDEWRMRIEVMGRRSSPDDKIRCVFGEGHPAAEDCGGIGAWADLKKAYRVKEEERSGRQMERIAWYEQKCGNGDELGLAGKRVKEWDQAGVNEKLARIELGEVEDPGAPSGRRTWRRIRDW